MAALRIACLLVLAASAATAAPTKSTAFTLPIARAAGNVTVNATITFTVTTPKGRTSNLLTSGRPAVFLLNGFNVASRYYSDVVARIAQKGQVLVATADEARTFAFPIPGLPRAGCPAAYTVITGAHLAALYTSTSPDAALFRKVAAANGVVVVGHSNGGIVAAYLLGGMCDTFVPARAFLCDGYVPLKDAAGAPLIKAAAIFEGYPDVPVTFPAGASVLYLTGAAVNATLQGYLRTNASCKAIGSIASANHYGLVNFVPGVNGTQVAPCARPAAGDSAAFVVAPRQQAAHIRLVADAAVQVLGAYKNGSRAAAPDFKPLQGRLGGFQAVCA